MLNHIPVLLNETIELLNIKPNGIYVDATLGYGGHTSKIIEKLNDYGKIICFDKDLDALKSSKEKLKKYSNQIKFVHSDFKYIKNFIDSKVDGIIYDLGMSTPQIETSDRGFSYKIDGPLDMRMNQNNKLTAEFIINYYPIIKLREIFFNYGDEKFAKKIAEKIFIERKKYKISTTNQLVKIIKSVIPYNIKKNKHPAKKTFQAIRMEVNDEINSLKISINSAIELLKQNSIICVISFHSIEDRIVKKIFVEQSKECICSKKLPICICNHKPKIKLINKKPIIPSTIEILKNSKSHSAKLRSSIKL